MAYYGHHARSSLLSMLRHLHERQDTMLCRDMLLALSRGRVHGIASVPDLVEDDSDYYRRLQKGWRASFSITVGADTGHGHASSRALPAHLPFGFRTVTPPTPHHAILPCARPAPPDEHGAQPAGRASRMMRPCHAGIARSHLNQCTAEEFAARVATSLLAGEDNACIGAMNEFRVWDEDYDANMAQPLLGLRRFVRGMDRRHGGSMKADTVFVSHGLFSKLVADGASRNAQPAQGTPNILDHGGMRILAHQKMPNDQMVAMSHMRGPIFVDGPVTLTCHRDSIDVARYCDAVPLPRDSRGRAPCGFMVYTTGD